jgi:Acetyltransferase (GNAT) domain
MKTSNQVPRASIFHEYWWLEAVTGGQFFEVEVTRDDYFVGRLPFSVIKRNGFRILGMPDFTHLLGPFVSSGDGKPQTRMMNRLSAVGSLIKPLPPFDFFKQVIDPLADEGLAAIDGLAFQSHGFQVGHQYTFHLDCRSDLKTLRAGMESRVRQNIRRAEEQFTIETIDDPYKFVTFYMENLEKTNRKSYLPFDRFPVLFSECRARHCGLVLAIMRSGGVPVAMTFIVWDTDTMYYLLTTRAPPRRCHDRGNRTFPERVRRRTQDAARHCRWPAILQYTAKREDDPALRPAYSGPVQLSHRASQR